MCQIQEKNQRIVLFERIFQIKIIHNHIFNKINHLFVHVGSQNCVCTCLRHQINQFMFIFTEERVVSNLSRVVVIIWCFVVLILTQSCTVSLTSLLTVQKLQPKITDVNKLTDVIAPTFQTGGSGFVSSLSYFSFC